MAQTREELCDVFWRHLEPDPDAYSNHIKLLLMRLSTEEIEEYLRTVFGLSRYEITGDHDDFCEDDEE